MSSPRYRVVCIVIFCVSIFTLLVLFLPATDPNPAGNDLPSGTFSLDDMISRQAEPPSLRPRLQQALNLRANDQPEQAVDVYRDLIKLTTDPETLAGIHVQLAKTLINSGREPDSVQHLEDAISLTLKENDNSPFIILSGLEAESIRADILARQNKLSSEQAYTLLLAEAPDSEQPLILLSSAFHLRQNGQVSKSMAAIKEIESKYAETRWARDGAKMADLLARDRSPYRMLDRDAFNSRSESYDAISIRIKHSSDLRIRGRIEEAMEYTRKTVSIAENAKVALPEAYLDMAWTAKAAGENSVASAYCDKVISHCLNPLWFGKRFELDAAIIKAEIKAKSDDVSMDIAMNDLAESSNGEMVPMYKASLGIYLIQAGKKVEAANVFRSIQQYYPNSLYRPLSDAQLKRISG